MILVKGTFTQPRGCAAQLTLMASEPDYGDFRLLEDHAQAEEPLPASGKPEPWEPGLHLQPLCASEVNAAAFQLGTRLNVHRA